MEAEDDYVETPILLYKIANFNQLLDEVLVISRIIKVEVVSLNTGSYIEHNNLEVVFLPLHWRQATRVARSWHDYPWKSITAAIHDMITRDLDMIIV